jgi:UDP-N-acetylmuramate dehydrogenase
MLIQENISLRDKNWFQTGGSARFFAQPTNASEFQQAIAFAQQQSVECFVLGQGANILIADSGFDGLVIRPQLTNVFIERREGDSVLVKAGSGVTMHDLIVWCLDNNVLGLEEFSGIPGTVGGSVYMNLHYYQFLLDQFLENAEIIHATTGEITTVNKEWFAFGYDQSTLQNKEYYLLNATFKLSYNADPLAIAFARGRRIEIIRHRVNRYPATNTCGSFFRNFHEDEVILTINNKKIIYVAYYLDKIGVKGTLAVGGARVSHQHANMLITSQNATSDNVIELARTMQEMVYENFGIIPQPECQLIGFKQWPLRDLTI